ncbi:hypothetical protein KV557_09900 [Kitasatospora aureofaciens]|uniref:phage tail tube protein n=1 Tax=Kitasatospora aureofaciens TaxID=1894 RepID=UPI001C446B74|nr:phage tail tube protein [Kitasatospora aureofaciens]MBV6697436.1 hypothetical protein [Kitasatospora aureofaciens]
MTQLARFGTLGLAKETTAGTYVAPAVGIPYTGSSGFEDMIAQIKDESIRGNDTALQGSYAGPAHAEWTIDCLAYPDLVGHFLAATIGPDTVTAGTSTTLSASTTIGATAIQTAVSLAAGTVVKIGTGAAIEYAITDGAATGTGPYTSNVTTVLGKTGVNRVGLASAHSSLDPVLGATTHTFKQSTSPLPTYSLTYYDTVSYVSCSWARFSELQIKIDPKGAVTLSTKATSFPSVAASTVSETYSSYDPLLGWSWTLTNAGASSTRGKSLDATIKRAVEAIESSDGTQVPREVFAGALEYDATLKAIFENSTDLALFLNNSQLPLTASVQQPLTRGGQSLTLTASKTVWHKGKRDMSGSYAQADFSISGVWNSTDGGAVQATLLNWQVTAY